MLAGREGGAPRPGEDVLQVADHAGVAFRQFRRDLVARRHEILQGFTDGRVGGLVGEFPSSIEESGGRGGREAVVFLAGLNVGQPGEIAKLGICVGLLERMQFTLQAPGSLIDGGSSGSVGFRAKLTLGEVIAECAIRPGRDERTITSNGS